MNNYDIQYNIIKTNMHSQILPTSITIIVTILLIFKQIQCSQIQCPSQYFFDIQHCQICSPYCKCNTYLGCTQCIDGYTLYKQKCIACPSASGIYGKCTSCCSHMTNTQLTCTNCQTVANYYSYLMAGRCVLSLGCQQINAHGFCTTCMQGYFIYNNLCQSCHPSCSTCVALHNCLTCNAGYYWPLADYGLCTACPPGCNLCTLSTNTLTYTSYNNVYSNNLVCSSCLDGYYLYNNHCLPCAANCLTCIDGSTCTACTSAILISSLCISCNDTSYGGSLGCLTCTTNKYFIQCQQCAYGYFLDTYKGVCRPCDLYISGAAMCSSNKVATQCKNDHDSVLTRRYYLVGISCVLNTKSCKQMADLQGNCSTCYDKYVLNKGACLMCPFTGCNASTTTNNLCVCFNCTTGYYLSGVQCLPCSVAHCSLCPTSSTCSICSQGYYLSTATSCLNATAANCLQSKTNSSTLCAVCTTGYYLGTDLYCYSCQTNCLSCSSRVNCLQCSPNTILSNGYCISYPLNCVQATLYNNNVICTLCAYAYYLNAGICSPCSIQLGTLNKCDGLCPIDQQIQTIMLQIVVYQPYFHCFLYFSFLLLLLSLF